MIGGYLDDPSFRRARATMTRKQRLSVAMCTFNGAQFLPQQLESLVSQTLLPDELVVCDDRSNDSTAVIVRTFARRAPFAVRLVVNEETLGSTRNFERAIQLCEGDIIFLSDQDDVWLPAKAERIQEVFDNNPGVGGVFSNAEIVDHQLTPAGYRLWDAIRFTRGERDAVKSGGAVDVLLKHSVATGATMAFRRDFVRLVTPIPASWIHDGWIALLIAAVSRLECIEAPLIRYRQHSRNQVGALKKDLEGQVSDARAVPRTAYLIASEQYKIALQRLSTLPTREPFESLAKKLESKILHQSRRGTMPRSLMIRALVVMREVVSRRYHRYSGGYRSALKDLAGF